MAYTTPLTVFQSMERIEEHEQGFTNVSGGDTLQLDNKYIIKDAYPSEGKTAIVTVGGNVQSSTDYTVDFEQNEIQYSGTATGDATVRFKTGPYNSNEVLRRIKAVESEIDRRTNTTFDGLGKRTDELYDGGEAYQNVYVFASRPVRNVSKVAVNKPDASTGNPNYVSLTEGLGEDYLTYKNLGIRFTDHGESPNPQPEDLQVTYDYGFKGVPGDIEKVATLMVVDDLVRGTVSGAMVDGRDNFDPQTVNVNVKKIDDLVEGYRIDQMRNLTNLAVEG